MKGVACSRASLPQHDVTVLCDRLDDGLSGSRVPDTRFDLVAKFDAFGETSAHRNEAIGFATTESLQDGAADESERTKAMHEGPFVAGLSGELRIDMQGDLSVLNIGPPRNY